MLIIFRGGGKGGTEAVEGMPGFEPIVRQEQREGLLLRLQKGGRIGTSELIVQRGGVSVS